MIIVNRIVLLLNLVFALALSGAYLAPIVSPSFFWPIAFFGLAYPFLLIINLLFIIYWAFFGPFKMAVSIGVILIGWGKWNHYLQFSGKEAQKSERMLKVVTFNAKMFGSYENQLDYLPVFNYLKEEKPDIICFQEFFSSGTGDRNMVTQLKKLTGLKNMYFQVLEDGKRPGDFGLAIFSRYPIAGKGVIDFETNTGNRGIYTDVVFKGDTVRIFDVHLQSIKLVRENYRFMQQVPTDRDTALYQGKNIMRRMKQAFIKRASQAEMVQQSLEASPHPAVVCGDFNDSPLSYAYHTVAENMKDAFVESGSGFERTYVGPMPSFRIDYILFNKKFSGFSYKSKGDLPSDHKMVQTLIQINN